MQPKYSKDAWAVFKIRPWQLRESFLKKSPVDRGNEPFPPQPHIPLKEETELDEWNRLKIEVAECAACRFYAKRKKMVFGEGKASSSVMVIGEAPSAEDDQTGEPFSGKSGEMLRAMLSSVGVSFDCVFLNLAMKCKAEKPTHAEILACRPFLMRQIRHLNPKLILLLGKTAAFSVLNDSRDLKDLREEVFLIENAQVVVSFHPAHLFLKPEDKKGAWWDLLRFKALLEKTL